LISGFKANREPRLFKFLWFINQPFQFRFQSIPQMGMTLNQAGNIAQIFEFYAAAALSGHYTSVQELINRNAPVFDECQRKNLLSLIIIINSVRHTF
jgi:hypothetical protein